MDALQEQFEAVSNWGRWGPDDERGALNLITTARRAAILADVSDGEVVSLALPLTTTTGPDCPHPVTHRMLQTMSATDGLPLASADFFAMAAHGMSVTHLDALCHIFWGGRMWNGHPQSDVTARGATRCGIDVARQGIVGRGVLLDVAATRGVAWLEPTDVIEPADLDAAEVRHGVTVGEGDLLFIRTGRAARRAAVGPWEPIEEGLAGLGPACLPWLHERGVAVLGADGTSDCFPFRYGYGVMPIHVGALVYMGVHLVDNADLEALAAVCARKSRHHFLLTIAPLILEGGTASPVNPIAVF